VRKPAVLLNNDNNIIIDNRG